MQDRELLDYILNTPHNNMTNEEIIHLLLENTISENGEEKETFAQRASDKMAAFAGSWTFILSFTAVLIGWIGLNLWFGTRAFDPYPFILLNLVLSCVAAIQAPLIMMSQNRQEEKDRARAENDYKVNLKTEILIEDLYKKVTRLLARQEAAARAEETEGKEHAEEHTHEPAVAREVKAHGASESSGTHCRPKGKA